MTDQLHVPPRACSTCPYRRDTPPGIWSAEEYAKLRGYDEQWGQDPVIAVFHCHQETATGCPTVCRGWLSTHRECVAVRLACAMGLLCFQDVPQDVEPLYYGTGNEAADAGLVGVPEPGSAAKAAIHRLVKSGVGDLEYQEAHRQGGVTQ